MDARRIRRVSAGIRAGYALVCAARENFWKALFMVASVTMLVVASTASTKLGKLPAGNGGTNVLWCVLGAVSCISMVSILKAVVMAVIEASRRGGRGANAPPRPPSTLDKIIFALAVAALLAVIAVSELDLEPVLELLKDVLDI